MISIAIFLTLLVSPPFLGVTSQGFGDVIEQSNSNTRLIGYGNRGYVISNSNINVESYSTSLDLRSNSNCNLYFRNCSEINMRSESNVNVRIENCNLMTRSNSHVSLRGDSLTGLIESNSQTDITATNCVLNIKSNSNCRISGRDRTLDVQNQSNCNINGRKGRILAFSNENLNVTGDGHNAIVTNTSDHTLLASADGNQEVHIQATGGKNDTISYTVLLKYKNSVEIKGQQYRLNIHEFQLVRKERNLLGLRVGNGNQENDGSLKITPMTENSVVITLHSNKKREDLTITGPFVKVGREGEVLIFLS